MNTTTTMIFQGCLSFPDQMGHIDFYPTGGDHQPGCSEICAGSCTEGDLIDLLNGMCCKRNVWYLIFHFVYLFSGACSHSRANQIWIESINSGKGFTGTQCGSYADYKAGKCSSNPTQKMGYSCTSTPKTGKYFFDINEDSPFAQG